MKTIRATFDGRVFVPEQPVDLPVGSEVDITVPENQDAAATAAGPSVWDKIMTELDQMPDTVSYPPDYAQQIDHYLYGTPKKDNP